MKFLFPFSFLAAIGVAPLSTALVLPTCGLPGQTFSLKAKIKQSDIDSIATTVGLKLVAKNGKPLENLKPVSKRDSHSTPDGKITLEKQLDYSRNGSTVLRSLIDQQVLTDVKSDLRAYYKKKELDAWRQKVEVGSNDQLRAQNCASVKDCRRELRKLNLEEDNLPFLQLFNTWRDVKSVKVLTRTLGKAASILLDVPSVRVYQDALFVKRSQDGPTPWHTDARMAPFDTTNMITFWIPLQKVKKGGSALLFVPKSHNDFALPFWNDFDGPEYTRLEDRYKGRTVHYMPMALGDVTVHSGFTLHCADGNYTGEDRIALAISYVDAQAEIRETALSFVKGRERTGYGDNEDYYSYKDWIDDVPVRSKIGNHSLIPIVWPLN
mmetsp:Transcript_26450/g.39126  ORF Transcript_26450/g.39126 Transcript_26450/m.39126 type:complete len:380 (-) Transcript_26450:1845-2984(-)